MQITIYDDNNICSRKKDIEPIQAFYREDLPDGFYDIGDDRFVYKENGKRYHDYSNVIDYMGYPTYFFYRDEAKRGMRIIHAGKIEKHQCQS